jgi:hypothetical protein
VQDNMIDAFETAKVMTMLPFQLPIKNPSLSIGSVFGAILGFAPLMGTTLYRFIVENAKSLASIPSYMKNNAYPLESGRKYFEQYGFGCIGFSLGYTCFLIKNALLIAAYVGLGSILAGIKAISIKINPRFTSEVNEKLGAKKNTFHELYAELNNINRKFPEETPIVPTNLAGGKGFYAFVGKVMDLNTPSLSEKLLDKSLQIFLGNPEVNREDFNQQLQQDETIDADFDKNQAHIVSTLFKAS